MNCIIVDDERNSQLLGGFVAKCSTLNLVGTFSDSVSALNQLSGQHNVDLAFIDFKTAGLDSFDVLNGLRNPPNIIAVSSNGQYALKAFDYSFVDYLLKPVSYSRFYRAVDKAIRYNSQKGNSNIEVDKEIFIRKDSSLIKLNMKDITYIEALENYIILNTLDRKFTLHFTMKGIESQLLSEVFLRVHRSFIVNKRLIKTIDENNLQIILGSNLKDIPVGKSYRDILLNDIRIMSKY